LLKASRYIRRHSKPDEIVQDSENDPRLMLSGLADRQDFAIESIDEKRKVSKWWLVVLPGYGFAKVSISQRRKWETMIEDFLKKRETLAHVFLLIDSRHEPQKLDLDFVNKMGSWEIPFTLVFTKSDKENQRTVAANVKGFLQKMRISWQFLPRHFVTSAEKKLGRVDILRLIGEMNEDWKKTAGMS